MTRSEKSLLRYLHGNVAPKLKGGEEYREFVLILGGRSGKSRLTGGMVAFEACTNDWNPYIGPGEFAWHFVISRREVQAIDIGRSIIFANIKQSPYLRALILDDEDLYKKYSLPRSKTGIMALKTGAAITALPCSGTVARGYPIAMCILDEVAFFARESKVANTDQKIYESILPRMIQFGDMAKFGMISTPADKAGLLWRKWKTRNENRDLYYILKCETKKIRTDWPESEFEFQRRRLGNLAYRIEFGAEFAESLSPLLQEKEIRPCLRRTDEPIEYDNDNLYYISIDAAFGERDRFAIAVAHCINERDKFRIIVDHAEIIEGDYETDVHDAAVNRIVQIHDEYMGFGVIADQYQADAFKKTLEDRGVDVDIRPWSIQRRRSCYSKLRACIHRRLIDLPNNEDLIEELLGLEVRYLPSGQYTIQHRVGGHDDIADAIASLVDELYEEVESAASIDFL